MTTVNSFEELVIQAQAEGPESQDVIEATLLTGLFTLPEATSKILSQTRPDDYTFGMHRDFASVIYPLLTEGSHVDLIVFKSKLPDPKSDDGDGLEAQKRQALIDFATKTFSVNGTAPTPTPTSGQIDAYLSIFTDRAKLRIAKALVARAGQELDAGEASPVATTARVIEAITDLEATRRLVGTLKSEGEELPAYLASLKAQQDPTRSYLGLNTGFEHFNNVANGLTSGLYVFGAAPSVGKTTVIKQFADQVVELNSGAVCAIFSYEQSRDELRVKTLSRLSGIENRDILRGRLDPNSDGWKKVEAAYAGFQKIAGRQYVIEAGREMTPDRIRLALTQIRRATKADHIVAFIDYLQIVPTEADFKDPRGKVDFVVSELRRVARDLGVGVVALSSVGRVSYDAPSLSSFKESGGVEYGADIGVTMSLDKDKSSTTNGEDTIQGTRRKWQRVFFDVVKNRNGEKARIRMKFYKAVSYFVEEAKENLPEES